jgi:hypothetical protein
MWRFLVSLMLIGSIANAAHACECPHGTHKENFRWAKSIFVGQAIAVGTNKQIHSRISDRPLYSVTFKVEKRLKGKKADSITVLTDSCSSMCCMVSFEEGKKYLVYVYKNGFVPSDCAWSAELKSDRAERNLKELNSFWFRVKPRLWPF